MTRRLDGLTRLDSIGHEREWFATLDAWGPTRLRRWLISERGVPRTTASGLVGFLEDHRDRLPDFANHDTRTRYRKLLAELGEPPIVISPIGGYVNPPAVRVA